MIILRIGWLCEAEYEWAQHVLIGKEAGLTAEEIGRIKAGPNARGWSEADKLLLQATDELRKDAFITDTTWNGLSQHFDTKQLMDVVVCRGTVQSSVHGAEYFGRAVGRWLGGVLRGTGHHFDGRRSVYGRSTEG